MLNLNPFHRPMRQPSPNYSGTGTPTHELPPLHLASKSLRPYILAIMAFPRKREFQRKASIHQQRLVEKIAEEEGQLAAALTPVFVGVAAVFGNSHSAIVAVAIHDSTYLLDFSVKRVELSEGEEKLVDHVLQELKAYERQNLSKFIGAGIPNELMKKSPKLCSRLWLELDIVPILFKLEMEGDEGSEEGVFWEQKCVDEQADSMARKCIMHFGPSYSPLLQVGYRGVVQIDSAGQVHLLTLNDFKATCGASTWESMIQFVTSLKQKGTKIAFFSSTPQGGGVALMRHALVRLAKLLGVDLAWYVPKPKPGVFRITKTMHNILQGVSEPDEWVSDAEKNMLAEWIEDNAKRYWLSEGGPLRPPSEGGADVIVIDDPQMPGLIPLIKKLTPNRPVLYRSHIQIRSDLIAKEGTPQADIWLFLWNNIQHADMFISHPIPSFVPANVPREKVAYLPATTDWLDGLNKDLDEWDQRYYAQLYNEQCHALRMTELKWPAKKYIVQVARFDPAKGIPDVVNSYVEFRRIMAKSYPGLEAPQLVICGNGSVDDPDGTRIYDQTLTHVSQHPTLSSSISVMRLPPNDQLLNTLISGASIVLQLSTREGFEVKVSEALHKGKPVIATKCGGIPLQIQDGVDGFLVEGGDWKAVSRHLVDLWTDDELFDRMSEAARTGVSDEVGTVGNALSWFFLADRWANGKGVKGAERWVNDLAREAAGIPYGETENRVPRSMIKPTH